MVPQGSRLLTEAEQEGLKREMSALVGRSHLFKTMDDQGRARLLQSGVVKSFAPTAHIMRQGEPGGSMFLILQGTVRVTSDTVWGDVDLAELGRGACLGEVGIITGKPRTATAEAITDVDCVEFQRHRLERILDDYPQVRTKLRQLVEARAQQSIDKMNNTKG